MINSRSFRMGEPSKLSTTSFRSFSSSSGYTRFQHEFAACHQEVEAKVESPPEDVSSFLKRLRLRRSSFKPEQRNTETKSSSVRFSSSFDREEQSLPAYMSKRGRQMMSQNLSYSTRKRIGFGIETEECKEESDSFDEKYGAHSVQRSRSRELRENGLSTMRSFMDSKSEGNESECDKCGKKTHITDQCPYFKKSREKHPDAQKKKMLGIGKENEVVYLENAVEKRMPGDGNCLFHSLSYLLGDGSNAHTLRREIASFVQNNPKLEIADVPLKDWILWDSGKTVKSYTSRMAVSGWGGGIECAACSRLKGVNVHIYEEQRSFRGGFRGRTTRFKRISAFDLPGEQAKRAKTINVLYRGGVHYNALVIP